MNSMVGRLQGVPARACGGRARVLSRGGRSERPLLSALAASKGKTREMSLVAVAAVCESWFGRRRSVRGAFSSLGCKASS